MKKRADGRYCKQILVGYKPDGKRIMRTIYGKTVKEVDKKERELRSQIENGINVVDVISVGEWADIWLKTFKSNIANNTYARYEGIITHQIKPYLGHIPINKIRLNIIQSMINELKEDMAPATIKKIKDVTHQMFQQAVTSQYIPFNPCEGVDIPKLKQKNRESIPKSHVKKIEQFCRQYSNGAFIMSLLYTGMRRGEILALNVEDIDMKEGVIKVNKAVEFIQNEPKIKTPKTPRSIRTIPILNPLIPYLKAQIEGKKKGDVVFRNNKDAMYTKADVQMLSRNFNKEYNKYLQETGDNEEVHFTMHQFRHTFCTMLYNAGVDVKMAQDILGHNSVNVTLDIYTHLNQESKKYNTEKINKYLAV